MIDDDDEAAFDAAVLELVHSPEEGLRRCISFIEKSREAGDVSYAHAQTQVVVQVLNYGGTHLALAEALARELVVQQASRTNLELLEGALKQIGKSGEADEVAKRAMETPLSDKEEVARALVAKMNRDR